MQSGSQEALQKVLASRVFRSSERISRFLRYIAERAMGGDPAPLKEYIVGVQVFDRGDSFDPRTDTIVRVEARRLRAKLREYYQTEGRDDPVIIELPEKGYAVTFRTRERPPAECGTSIAVLPFANLSGDPSNEYLADGLTEEIIGALASLPDLRVVARTSAFQFKGRGEDVRKIGRDLGVRTILEGSVRTQAQRIRVAAQLVSVTDGFHIWSQMYERNLTDVFRIEQEITSAIVDSLKGQLTPVEKDRLLRRANITPEAHDSYLRGLYFFHKFDLSAASRSEQYMQRAIALAPGYAAAHAGLADVYMLLCILETHLPREIVAKAKQAAGKALQLDDRLAEAHATMGWVYSVGEWDWTSAEREFRLAVALKPSFVFARIGYAAACLCPMRRFSEAIEQLHRADADDPVSALVPSMLAQTLVLAGRPDEALEALPRAFELDSGYVLAHLTHVLALEAKSRYREALDALVPIRETARDLPNYAGYLGYAYAKLGNRAEAEEVLATLLARYPGPWVPGYDLAVICYGLGDEQAALQWLERAYELRAPDVLFLRDDPRFGSLRTHPVCRSIIRGTGFEPD